MQGTTSEPIAHLIDTVSIESIDVLGPQLEFLVPGDAACVLRGTIPPGVIIPLHSHADPETFFLISGKIEGLSQSVRHMRHLFLGRASSANHSTWLRIAPGQVFHVPGNARHAIRNLSNEPATMILVTTAKLARFFREIGQPIKDGETPAAPPSGQTILHFLQTAAKYGYWTATPEENAAVGLRMPQPFDPAAPTA
jgi:quercetin dioxygenase-like cupin family protein